MNSGEELPNKNTAMENSYDCGPSMLASALQSDIKTIKGEWPVKWKNFNSFLDNLFDFPGMHFLFLKNNGFKFRLIDTPQPGCCCLIHFGDTFYTKLMNEHWIVFLSEDKQNGTVKLDWGNDYPITMASSVFLNMLNGFPRIMYLIGEEEKSLWNRFVILFWACLSTCMIPLLKIISLFR